MNERKHNLLSSNSISRWYDYCVKSITTSVRGVGNGYPRGCDYLLRFHAAKSQP